MKEVITMVKGYIDDIVHLMMSFLAVGAVSEVIFGTGVFGVNVIGNLTSIISKFGESGFAGLVALLVLVGLFRKYLTKKTGGFLSPLLLVCFNQRACMAYINHPILIELIF